MILFFNPKSKIHPDTRWGGGPGSRKCRENLKWPALLISLSLLGFMLDQGAAQSRAVESDHVTARLISGESAIRAGQSFEVGLLFQIEEHWHTYYRNPGDSGLATEIQWDLPEGFSASSIQWPNPMRLPFGPLTNFGYEGETLHVVTITPPPDLESGQRVVLKAKASWLVCKEICLPGKAELELELPVASTTQPPSKWASLFADFRESQPADAGAVDTEAGVHQGALQLFLPGIQSESALHFFPDQENLIENTVEPEVTRNERGILVEVPLAANASVPEVLEGILVAVEDDALFAGRPALRISTPLVSGFVGPAPETETPMGLWWAILLGFVGGLILNLMPCVFPVLGIKVMGFVNQAGEDSKKVILHGLTFTAGVLVSFWLLATVLLVLRASGQELGWGFQLQSAGFVFGLMIFLFAFGLNLSGVFEFGGSAVGVGSQLTSRGSWMGSFFSGVLATVVATPCAAPFLAPALGAALSLPSLESLMLFTAIALGLSAPYLVLSARPQLTKFLPKPGAWMESFKQCMAFPLYGTAAYLLWVLDGQVDEAGLLRCFFALVAIGLGLWLYGRWSTLDKPQGIRRGATVLGLMILIVSAVWAWPSGPEEKGVDWQPWSKKTEQALLKEGRTVYVDFTARWCATCQTNKAVVFSSQRVLNAFEDNNIATLKADWTNQDEAITRELARYGRSAVPFNVIYFPDRKEPEILPELLTPDMVLQALEK